MREYSWMKTLKKAAIAAAPGVLLAVTTVLLGATDGALGVLQGENAISTTALGVGALTGALIGLKNYLSNAR